MLHAFLAALALAGQAAGDDEWKVGLAASRITPEEPVFMAGYASRNKPSEGVAGHLYAKALALEDARGGRAVLVTADVIGFPAAVGEPICERIMEKAGLPRARVLLAASHTHTGPALGTDPSIGGPGTEEDRARTVAYTRKLQDRIVELAVEALGNLRPARLSWGWGLVHFPVNRREFTLRGVVLGVNPRGPVDRSTPVLRVDDPSGKLRAVLFQCACHCTTASHQIYEISGDYAGYAQEHVEAAHPGVQAMFMAGCGGDANPYPRGTLDLAREHGATLGREVCRVLAGRLQPVRGPLRAEFARIPLPFEPAPPAEELRKGVRSGPGYQREVFRRQLEILERGEKLPTHYPAPTAVWQFGPDLTLVALSGEVVVEYALRLERTLGPLGLWVAAYCNDVFGYVPSARILEEGGYETRGTYYGVPGIFSREVEDALITAVRDLAEKAGRPRK
jgi:hypothetical protein